MQNLKARPLSKKELDSLIKCNVQVNKHKKNLSPFTERRQKKIITIDDLEEALVMSLNSK